MSLQASALAKECSRFLEKVEPRCYSASTLSTLQMYEERLGGEFSTLHFQAVKAKACAMGSGVSGVMRLWNAAWVQCQELRQHLEEMQKQKKCIDKNQFQQSTAANPQGKDGGVEKKEKRSGLREGEFSLTQQLTSQKEEVKVSETEGESTTAACFTHYLKPDLKGSEKRESRVQNLPHAPVKNEKMTFPQNGSCQPESKWRPREHHSEADLRSADSFEGGDDFPVRQALARSLSEGSHVSCHLTSTYGFSPLNVRNKHCQSVTQPLKLNLQPVQNLHISHDESLRCGNLSCASKSDSNEEEGEGCTASTQGPQDLRTPETLLTPTENNGSNVL